MRRISIRSLMAVVVFAAVGLAALRNANQLWAAMMLTVALAAVGVAAIGAAIVRGEQRCWCAGFAFLGGGYLTLTFAPGFSTEVGLRLLTTTTLHYSYSQFIASSTQTLLPQFLWWQHAQALDRVDRLKAANRVPGDPELDSAMRILINLEAQLRGAADERDFIRIGHSLFALLTGLAGGAIAAWFWKWRERRPQPCESPG